eukprot:GGOE01004593.1.p1 GENE.GGOE01004593.1~~GGOE01004593.1.p1  ORF type:complete len:302 (-),score=75.13 GGOE01004593.1:148-1053(-)
MINVEQQQLKQSQEDFRARQWLVGDLNSLQEEQFLLDVGGELFRTSGKALRSKESSMLGVMVSGTFFNEVQDDGSFFLDRDPYHFQLVLTYLRDTCDFPMPEAKADRRALLREGRFYGLDRLVEMVHQYRPPLVPGSMTLWKYDPSRYNVTGTGTTLIKTNHTGPRMAICDPPMATGRHIWQISTTTPLLAMGIVSTDRHDEIQPGSDVSSYVFYGKPHETWHFNQSASYGHLLAADDVVEAELDFEREGGALSFSINGQPQGIAFRGIGHEGPFYAAVYVYSKVGHACTVLSYQYSLPDD